MSSALAASIPNVLRNPAELRSHTNTAAPTRTNAAKLLTASPRGAGDGERPSVRLKLRRQRRQAPPLPAAPSRPANQPAPVQPPERAANFPPRSTTYLVAFRVEPPLLFPLSRPPLCGHSQMRVLVGVVLEEVVSGNDGVVGPKSGIPHECQLIGICLKTPSRNGDKVAINRSERAILSLSRA